MINGVIMTRFKSKVILFLTMIFSLNTPASAFNQKGMVKIPGSVLSKGTTGVLREICLDKLVFVTYGSRGDSAAVQLTDGNKPLRCENTTLTVRKQYPVPSTMRNPDIWNLGPDHCAFCNQKWWRQPVADCRVIFQPSAVITVPISLGHWNNWMFANSRDDDAVIIVSSVVANFLVKLRSKDGLFTYEHTKSI